MIVTENTKSFPHNAEPSDFNFLRALINELTHLPTKDKVLFPLESRSSVFADIECILGYNEDYKPYAEFFFRSRKNELEMAHSAVVFAVVDDGVLNYQLQHTPNKRLRSNGHRKITTLHADAKATALAICRNYAPGTVGRKVIPLLEKKPAVSKESVGWPAGANGM